MTQEEDRIRTIAGYLLKNNARLILSAPPEVAEYVKSAVLQAFDDSSIMIRNAASQDIVAFLGVLEPKNWPECLQHLVLALDSPNFDLQEVRCTFLRLFRVFWRVYAVVDAPSSLLTTLNDLFDIDHISFSRLPLML